MAKELKRTVHYYYDAHPTEEDLMGETWRHDTLIDYLKAVLRWLFRGQACVIYSNLNFYHTLNEMEYPVAPDLAVIKGVENPDVRSWTVGETGPGPLVVIEVLSEETWKKDLQEKPGKYALMGVQEYFVYDPNEPAIRRGKPPPLLGWRLDPEQREMVSMVADPAGRLWSEQLESWLVPNGALLRLFDRTNRLRLAEAEAEAEGRRAEAKRAEAEARRAEALAEKLRTLGINPDEIA